MYMKAYIFHNSVGVFIMKRNNCLFSRQAFCCDLDLSVFGGQFIESHVVDFDDLLI